MEKVAIVGVGHSKFGRRTDLNLNELAFESIKEALIDAGITSKDIEHVTVGTMGGLSEESLPAVVINEYAGFNSKGLLRVEAACATGSAAIREAYANIASGLCDVAIAIGVEKMTQVEGSTAIEMLGRAGSYLWEFENYGLTFPAYYAMYAIAHMKKFKTTEEQLGLVSVKAHKYGAMNNLAEFQKEINLDKVLNSPVVSWPLRLYNSCPVSDGSASVVLASEKAAKKLTDTPIWIKGIGAASDTANLSKRQNFTEIKSTSKAAEMAYKMAKISPKDIDVANVHDCFSISEIMAYEDLGFCKKGEGGKLIENEDTYIDGRIPVNLDGGLKAKGHPIGATGTAMIVEITKQLRNEGNKRQARIKNGLGLVHNLGGTGHTCYVTVLSQ